MQKSDLGSDPSGDRQGPDRSAAGVFAFASVCGFVVRALCGCPTAPHSHFSSLVPKHAHPEHGGIRVTSWGYGVWGAVILVALVMGISYGAVHGWSHKLTPVVLYAPAPLPPINTTQQVVRTSGNNAARETKTSTPPAHAGASHSPAPNNASQTPSQTSPQVAQSQPPVTFLDRVVQENRGFPPDDRNRLSTELYECDQFIKQSQAVGYKLNAEFGKLSNDRQTRALATNVDSHVRFLQDLDTSAWDQYHGLQRFQDKWQYFLNQTEYVFGDNPFHAGEGLLVNAVEGMANALTSWSRISNRDQQDILNIEAQQQVDFEKNLRQFFDWGNGTHERIKH
jgi:hypothetical protein